MTTHPKETPSASRRLTAEQRSRIVTAKAKGAGTKQLAQQYGVSEQTIRNVARRVKAEKQASRTETAMVTVRAPIDHIRAFEATLPRLGVPDKSTALRAFIRWPAGFFHADEAGTTAIQDLRLEISRIGTNINQIARRLNNPSLRPQEIALMAAEKAELRGLSEAMGRVELVLATLAGNRARRGDRAFALVLTGGGDAESV